MKIASRYKNAFEDARQSHEYWAESAKLELCRQLVGAMRALGLSQEDLALRLGRETSFVKQVFDADYSATVPILSEIAHGLGMHLDIRLVPNAEATS